VVEAGKLGGFSILEMRYTSRLKTTGLEIKQENISKAVKT